MVELLDSNKQEDELVDLIRSKLKTSYQERLVLCPTYTVEELNDACLKIETSIESKFQSGWTQSKFQGGKGNAKTPKPRGNEKKMEKATPGTTGTC